MFKDVIKNDNFIFWSQTWRSEKSVETIKKNFEGLQIAGFHHGYIKKEKNKIVSEIIAFGAGVDIIGMGTLAQDGMCVRLKNAGFIGSDYTVTVHFSARFPEK